MVDLRSERLERRDPVVDLRRSEMLERRGHPADPGNGQLETRPKNKPKDPDYNKKYYRNVVKPKLEAKKAERVTRSHLMEKLLGTTVAVIIELMRSSSAT